MTSDLTRSRIRTAWLFLAPMLLVLALVAAWPLARTLYFSLTDAELSRFGEYSFIGFANFLASERGVTYGILADPLWWKAVGNTLLFALVSVFFETVLGVIIALVLNAQFPGRALMRAAVLIPWAIPTVVSAKMWAWMLHDQFGIVNDALLRLGLISAPVAWLASSDLALWSVVAVDVWKTTPFVALMVLAALQMLPRDCYEAARVDGIHPIRVFFHVTLPLIKPALIVAVIFRLLDAMRVFDIVYIMTGNAEATMTMSVYARQQFVDFQDVGFGSAASTLLFAAIALLTVIYLMATRADLGGRAR
ncbi:MAG: sugar ABC transporter permease [Oceanibaculum nanhaiense]|uniref:carbohydrate ABC transporter permease n=1 Tax=Oceanibaculum nanhaiense TaxID=1909734 RepID=UPI0025A406EE|nr:sugar ABC transporter permease [Oceanibaculum nanhaiense]MDM7945969.1 sugar ABC transporter permease [Oceanibaculum nanhaiense]